ncbi:MAG: hypothetical protein K8R90_10150 [Candidatus Cloacimonetes bacterium]|nr:hypothetical protein [Candidatus Cloacimonadota bacterium]
MRVAILVLTVCCLLLVACDKTQSNEWTILVYMAADNGLTLNADEDINEMEAGGVPAGVTLIVLVDRNAWSNDPGAVVYRIEPDSDTTRISSPVITHLGEADTADPMILAEFAHWGFSRWRSGKRALVVWGHGNAWYRAADWKSVCDDAQSNSTMSVADGELRQALLGIPGGVDLLMFDACLMQTAEVVAEVSDRAGWITGSLDKICVDGYAYDDLMRQWPAAASPAEMAARTVSTSVDSYRPGGSQYDPGVQHAAFSATNTGAWIMAQNAVADFVQAALAADAYSLLHDARAEVSVFNDRDEMIDLVEYLRIVELGATGALATAAGEAAEALEQAVPEVDLFGYSAGATGRIAVWFPEYAYDFDNWQNAYAGMRWPASTGWDLFLSGYHAALR